MTFTGMPNKDFMSLISGLDDIIYYCFEVQLFDAHQKTFDGEREYITA